MSDAVLNQTVLDVLRNSPAGSMLDLPVPDVLTQLGIPQLPTIPQISGLPEIALPSIDPTALIQPAVDLLSGFGTGASGGGFDISDVFSLMSGVLSDSSSATSQAVSKVSTGWQSDAAVKAQQKSLSVVDDIGNVQVQGTNQKAILLDAERVVAQGYAELSVVIAKFVAEVIAGIALLVTPAGIPTLLAMASQVIAEATVIAARTRGELTIKTAQIVAAGMKVPVTGAPTVADAAQLANLVMQSVQPLVSPATELATKVVEKGSAVVSGGSDMVSDAVSGLQSSISGIQTATNQNGQGTTAGTPSAINGGTGADSTGGTGSGAGGGSGLGGLIGGSPATSPASSPLTRAPVSDTSSPTNRAAATSTSNAAATGRSAATPMMPGMGGANRAGAAEDSAAGNVRTDLVTTAHGDEVVGNIEGVSNPVIGGVEVADEPPDKALTL
ncbi:hypothetical protein [Nocardia sp. NPDC058666]|uniref:hypothetical protein n=1 Tax=unclassified Nocardia TaxID=2637762 RepID=UPI00365DB48C